MIITQPLDGTPSEHFENFCQLFDCIITTEALKSAERTSNSKPMNWSFIVYPAGQVDILLAAHKKPSEALREAFEEYLPLIEICTGDYKHPTHIVLTPNVDMHYLKKKWYVDWCAWHHIVVREV
ncbi:MAG: hypothetical protein ACOH2E_08150 [Candidatus Paracaedibacter sp.]